MSVTHKQCTRAAEERRRCTARFNDLAREVTRLGIAKKNILAEIERFKSAIADQKLSGGEVTAQSKRCHRRPHSPNLVRCSEVN